MLRIGILASGKLGFESLKSLADISIPVFVLTDKGSEDVAKWCKALGIPCFSGNPRNGAAFSFFSNLEIDVLISINYLFLIEKDLINHPRMFALNIHGSLLPKYRGRTPHVWAIINGETETGITLHQIAEGCDTGPIAIQKKVLIEEDDTAANILGKFESLYPEIILEALQKIEEGTLELSVQDESEATYYGKRTPADGAIDWNWNSKQISDWVRAQAYPYPGAFAFIDNQKLTIDKVTPLNQQADSKIRNGTVISENPPVVKCSNGALMLTSYREKVDLKLGSILCPKEQD